VLSTFVIVLTTMPAEDQAAGLARTLVEERLAACVNVVGGVTSVYLWQGEIQQDRECQLLIKTREHLVEPLRERLQALHPYEVPEFLVLQVAGGSGPYLAWLDESLPGAGSR
jgi:periplasmic divalent cation tolerance protein